MPPLWNKQYQDQISNRILDDIIKTPRRLELTRPGRTMPDEDNLAIGAGRQMNLAILFLDICGFTKQESDSYEEQKHILAILNIFMGEMIRIIKDYEGEFEKNTGDGLMAYFGTETSDPKVMAKNAVDAAMTMLHSNYKVINYLFAYNDLPPINFRIGIDLGEVTIANIGAPYKEKALVAIGATANIACRLLAAGRPREILIGEYVKRQLPYNYKCLCRRRFASTGYFWGKSRYPYPVHQFNGRWKELLG